MAGQDTVSFDEVLRTVWGPAILELVPQKIKLLELFEERDANDWGGREVQQTIHIGRNRGVGAYSEMGAVPAAGQQEYATARIPMRYIGGRIQLSAQVMKASQGPRHAAASAMEEETTRLIKDLRAELNRMLNGDGRGVLAFVNGDPSTGTTITVDSPHGVAGATNGNRFISVNDRVTFVNPATGAIRASADHLVSAYAAGGTTYTASAAAAAAVEDNDYIVRANKATLTDVSDTSYAKETMGLRGHVDDGTYVSTYFGLNRTTFPKLQASVIAVNGAVSGEVIQKGLDMTDQRGDGEVSDFVLHHSVRRAYLAVTEDARRYQGGDLSNPDAGTRAAKRQAVTFGGIPFMEEKYCDYGVIYGIDRSNFIQFVEEPGKWFDDDGSILQRLGSGTTFQHGVEGFYYIWKNFFCKAPNQSVRFDGISASVAVVHVD